MTLKKVLPLLLTLALLISCFPILAMADPASFDPEIDNTKWQYNEADDVYYQLMLQYCAKPESPNEYLGIYVPGAYMDAVANGDGTYTVKGFTDAAIGQYTAADAPMIIPVDTGSWKSIVPHDTYKPSAEALKYLGHGYIYLNIGVRGKNEDSSTFSNFLPWAVVDFKAAIRYLRFNDALIPGSTDRFFSLGHSAGGAQSGLVGGTGDAEEFFPYLAYIGALGIEESGTGYTSTISDATFGCLQYCPIASHRATVVGYEWMMGQFLDETVPQSLVTSKGNLLAGYVERTTENGFHAMLSDDMAAKFAEYVNEEVTLRDPETGERLTLEASDKGIYLAGSFYDYYMDQIDLSLNNYLAYQAENDPAFDAAAYVAEKGARLADDTYADTVGDPEKWIEYDAGTGTAKVDSMRDFVVYCKIGSVKITVSSDGLEHSSTNFSILNGTPEGQSVHYSKWIADMIAEKQGVYSTLAGWKDDYLSYLTEPTDPANADAVGNTPRERSTFCDQLYYSLDDYDGEATLAKHWRIHSGIAQSDVGLNTEGNLYLALAEKQKQGEIDDVEFAMIWDQKHVKAEPGGQATAPDEFIAWVDAVCSDEPEPEPEEPTPGTGGTSAQTEEPESGEPIDFADVADDAWYKEAVDYVSASGLMIGVGDGNFAPEATLNRATLAELLYRLAGSPEVTGSNTFKDVPENEWYTDAVIWAHQNGVVQGMSSEIFAPTDPITREQIAVMLFRFAVLTGRDVSGRSDLSAFPDAGDVDDWAAEAMSWAVAEGLLIGSDGKLDPTGNATRAQIATILMRYQKSEKA